MRDLFPVMTSCPEPRKTAGTFVYWILSILLFPLLLPFFLQFFNLSDSGLVWLQLAFHGVNCAVMVVMHWQYLSFAWMDLKRNFRECLVIIAVCAALILAISNLLAWFMDTSPLLYAVPVVEVELMMFAGQLLSVVPAPAFVCIVLIAPLTVSCMIYAVCFAPGCCSGKPWTGYLLLVLLVALPRVFCTTFSIDARYLWPLYFTQLPVHLICCWAFQKTDTVLVPAGILMIVNLVGCVLL